MKKYEWAAVLLTLVFVSATGGYLAARVPVAHTFEIVVNELPSLSQTVATPTVAPVYATPIWQPETTPNTERPAVSPTIAPVAESSPTTSATPSSQPPAPTFTAKPTPHTAININTADATTLQELPGIGPAMAGRIIAEREKAAFSSVDDLTRVKGIGAKTLEKLRAFVTV